MNNIKSISDLTEQETLYTPKAEGQIIGTYEFTTPGTSWNDIFIEVSMPDGALGTRVSRKLNLGKLLTYITDSLNLLASKSQGTYLTRAEADDLYLSLNGGTLNGMLTINNPDTNAQSLLATGAIECASLTATVDSVTGGTGNITCTSVTASQSATLKNANINGLTVTNGESITGTLTVNGNIKNDAGDYKAEFKNLSADGISSSAVTIDTSLTTATTCTAKVNGSLDVQGAETVGGSLTVGGATTLNGITDINATTTVESAGNLVVKGNIQLEGATEDKGRIYAGIGDNAPYLSKGGNGILISKAQIGTYSPSSGGSLETVLTIKGDTKSTESGTTLECYNFTCDNTSKFLTRVQSPEFIATGNDSGEGFTMRKGENGDAICKITLDKGFYQSQGNAQLTAQAACWA